MTFQDFTRIYNTKYIPDYGDIYITFDAIAFSLAIPASKEGAFSLENTFGHLSSDNILLESSWVPVELKELNNLAKLELLPNFTFPTKLYVDTDNITFPLTLSDDEMELEFIKASHWTSRRFRENETITDVPPFRVSKVRATKLDDGSKVQIIFWYMAIVITCNILKLAMMWSLWRNSHEERFTTVGDAVQSFLERPDRSTIGLCLMERRSLIERFERQQDRRTAFVSITTKQANHKLCKQADCKQADSKQFMLIQPRWRERKHYSTLGEALGATQDMKPGQKLRDASPVEWKGRTTRSAQRLYNGVSPSMVERMTLLAR